MKETRKQRIARQALERDRLAGKRADRTFDPIRQAIDSGQLVIGPTESENKATPGSPLKVYCDCGKSEYWCQRGCLMFPDLDAIPDTERPGRRW